MQSSADLKQFYHYCAYESVLRSAAASVGRSINEEFPEILYSHDQKKLACSQASIASLQSILESSSERLCKFVKLKWDASLKDSLDGEFPPGEEPGEDEKSKVVEELPLYRDFLLPYLIEWHILSDRPDSLSAYIKCVRMPHAAKYEKNIRLWYSKAVS